VIAFDTETTGLLKPNACELWQQPHIIEFYACKFDRNGNILDEFETYIKPPVPLPEIITKITGITDSMLVGAPSFIEVYPQLVAFFLGETDVFAHNCTFDIGMLVNELRRHSLQYKFPWPVNQHCTVELSHCIDNKRLSLDKLYAALVTTTPRKGSHRAKQDVVDLVKCISNMYEEGFL
jgi:DNA polymerase III epsilon subunit-like protein